MPPFQKYGLLLLACFFCIVVFADFFASFNLNFQERMRIPSLKSYFPHYLIYGSDSNVTAGNFTAVYYDVTEEQRQMQDTMVGSGSAFVPTAVLPPYLTGSASRSKSFTQVFQSFPWAEFEDAAKQNYTRKRLDYSHQFIEELMRFLEMEPLVPVNETCQAPSLPAATEIDCGAWPKAFGSPAVKRDKPAKIGVLLQFGFDVDVLEIHMNELYDIVDQFFIIESTHAHYGNVKKPLMWEHVEGQDRFKKFPVTHFVIDDAEAAHASDKMWAMESLQERMRWDKFLEWNDATKLFGDDDILGFGDADEIPSRAKLNLLKHCEIPGESIDFGIWFPFGHIHQAFQTDFPVRGHPLTLGDPSYYTLKAAKAAAAKKPGAYPSRRRGGSSNYLLGGIHMTHYGYLPFQLVKYTTATEGGIRTLKDVTRISNYFKTGDIRQMEVDFGATPKQHTTRIKPLNMTNPEMAEICVLPWFYDCNRDRYPVWEGRHDTRLD